MKSVLIAIMLCSAVWATPEPRKDFNFEGFSHLAIQDRGRVKPFATFAEETLLFVTGKRSWKSVSSTEAVLGWLFAFDEDWADEPFIRVDHQGLKKTLGLEVSRNYFTMAELTDLPELGKIIQRARKKDQRKERQTDEEKKAVETQSKLGWVRSVLSGDAFTILPNPSGEQDAWFSLASLREHQAPPYSPENLGKLTQSFSGLALGFHGKDAAKWNDNAVTLISLIRQDLAPSVYPPAKQLNIEVHYQRLHAFRWAWVSYLFAFIVSIFAAYTASRIPRNLAGALLVIGFLLHTYGFALRVYIAGRPPVTNMYESVIWVSWGSLIFAALIWSKYRNGVILASSVLFTIVCLVLADLLPTVLDAGIHPLEPVLRSNFWLTIHVLTITLSYAAFAVSLCLGNVNLGNFLFRPTDEKRIQQYTLYMYRAMQIGVILLGAGTILGGVWADYSWGRFWGWDPKEVWALIAFLLYVAVLHGRFSGLLKGFGFTAATVVCFLGVLMAWYGVNFVLGVGLHAYGFGTGGIQYVVGYVLAQILYILIAYFSYRKSRGSKPPMPVAFPK